MLTGYCCQVRAHSSQRSGTFLTLGQGFKCTRHPHAAVGEAHRKHCDRYKTTASCRVDHKHNTSVCSLRNRSLLLEDLLDNLLLLNQECTHNALAYARRTTRASVCARHILLPFADTFVFARAQRRNLCNHGPRLSVMGFGSYPMHDGNIGQPSNAYVVQENLA